MTTEEDTAISIAQLIAAYDNADHLKALFDEVYCEERRKIKMAGKAQQKVVSVTELIKRANPTIRV
jgi:hypothetical protein